MFGRWCCEFQAPGLLSHRLNSRWVYPCVATLTTQYPHALVHVGASTRPKQIPVFQQCR
jgi:hypothetical protein